MADHVAFIELELLKAKLALINLNKQHVQIRRLLDTYFNSIVEPDDVDDGVFLRMAEFNAKEAERYADAVAPVCAYIAKLKGRLQRASAFI